MCTFLFGIDLASIKNFEDFATSHCAYDEEGNEIWAPSNMHDFIVFMNKFYGDDYEAQSNFREGVELWEQNFIHV